MAHEDLIRKLWQFPVLRPQIPALLESNRKKCFALRDATDRQEEKYNAMLCEYNRLLAEEARVNRTV